MPPQVAEIRQTTEQLLDYCRREQWAGYDPYDGLNSRIFQALKFLHSRWPRLVMIQSFKRSPINLRPLFAVSKAVNPKGAALFLSSFVRLETCGLATVQDIREMADRLIALRSKGWDRACWGYHFDWQTRTYLVPRFYPNIICTTFAGEALLDAHERLGDPALLELATQAGWFLLENLKRTPLDDTFCFSYTPLRPSRVHNASLLGAALLARLHSKTAIPEFRTTAEASTRYGIRHQQADGSWIYGEDPNQGWIDSFHTGYNLLALRSVATHLKSPEADACLRRGFDYYKRHFFTEEGIVKYFHDRVYPIDTHGVAHAILTFCLLGDLDPASRGLADRIYQWSVSHLRHPEGRFYYQITPRMTNRISYMRWTQAWMLRALAEYLATAQGPGAQPARARP